MKQKTNSIISKYVFGAAVVIYGCLCCYLFYMQLTCPVEGLFEADTPVHVSMAVDDHFAYSITAFIYLFFNLFGGLRSILIAAFLSITAALSVFFTEKLIKECLKIYGAKLPNWIIYFISLAANFVMGFYIKAANVQHYIGYQSANMWHNSTYTVMRLVAILVLIKYLQIYQKKELKLSDWLVFAILLAVSTAVKPSFLVVFAPAMAIELVVDLIKKVPFGKVFLFGCAVIPSLFVLVLQSVVLFGNDTGNGYAIAPFKALSERGNHPKVTLILSVLFPLMILALHLKDFFKDRIYMGSLIIWFWGFFEVFLFTETGTRGGDGNFMWGYSISLFVVFLAGMIKLALDMLSGKKKIINYLLCGVAGAILLWHVISGVWYFALLFSGVTYFV